MIRNPDACDSIAAQIHVSMSVIGQEYAFNSTHGATCGIEYRLCKDRCRHVTLLAFSFVFKGEFQSRL
jgi:hypothetical protein